MQKLKLRRVLFQKFTITSRKNGWVEITGYCRPKPRPKPAKPPSVDGSYTVSENGFFVRETGGVFKVCPLSKTERKLVKYVVSKGNQADWEKAFSVVWPKNYPMEQTLRNMLSRINAKLNEHKFDVRLSLNACEVKIIDK